MHINPASPWPLSYDEWIAKIQLLGARYRLDGIDRHDFAGWVGARSICDLEAVELGCNAPRIRRTLQDTRLDNANHYYLLFQCAGQMLIDQNGRQTMLNSGEIALIDSSRPLTYASDCLGCWLSLHLPRKSLASYLGFEPEGGQCRNGGALPARLLRELISDDSRHNQTLVGQIKPKSVDVYMKLVVFDLVGALFSDRCSVSISPYTDRLFGRASDIIKNRFCDPDFGPIDVAVEMGISLRYLQTLFTARGTTCGQLIRSHRLNYAASLLRRHAQMESASPLTDVAYACGFRDYVYFARMFRRQFGHPPGIHQASDDISPLATARCEDRDYPNP
jgi:AraC family transcriptional regulator, positive regulator of tynA and feaB